MVVFKNCFNGVDFGASYLNVSKIYNSHPQGLYTSTSKHTHIQKHVDTHKITQKGSLPGQLIPLGHSEIKHKTKQNKNNQSTN